MPKESEPQLSDDDFAALGLFFVIAFIVYIVWWGITEVRTDANCLALGYPKGGVTYNFRAYCAREENETEIVLPLNDARKRGVMKP